ncbi:MAG: TetR/AcrR family transcriptional regulator [Deltaproteobacteria bacterium]|nr:TetR/AcrR family transcriptional regulator [Deltaproteobacteria bacterium]
MRPADPKAHETIVRAALQEMLAHGFHGTSLDRVCQAAGVTKGKFFHYFKGKEDLAQAVLMHFGGEMEALWAQSGALTQADPMMGLMAYLDKIIGRFQDPIQDSCISGVFIQEVSQNHPELRQMCNKGLSHMAERVEGLLKQVFLQQGMGPQVSPRGLAEHFIVVLQGAFILAKAKQSPRPVADHLTHYKYYLMAMVARRVGS